MKTTIHTLGVIAVATALVHGEKDDKKGGDRHGPPNPAQMVKHLDTDGNGSVSLAEFQASPRGQKDPERAAKMFARIDADSDGEITVDEFAKHFAGQRPGPGGNRPNPAEMIERLDKDDSGSVSKEEFLAGKRAQEDPERAAKLFERIDADSDGEITVDEFAKHLAGHRPGPGGHRPNPAEMIERLDKDDSGTVSKEEFLAGKRAEEDPERAAKLFDRIDADSDGEITVDEMAKHIAKHHGKKPRRGEGPGAGDNE